MRTMTLLDEQCDKQRSHGYAELMKKPCADADGISGQRAERTSGLRSALWQLLQQQSARPPRGSSATSTSRS